MAKKVKPTFQNYYKEIYGERWQSLEHSLKKENEHFELREGLLKSYYLDEASVWVANLLNVERNEAVLDLCAAPGGKSLCLALALSGTGKLVCNDRSRERRARLQKVLSEHLPQEIYEGIQVKGFDASKWGLFEKSVYDKILVDAPCSSERHLLQNPRFLQDWSPARTKNLSIQQMGILCSALDALKPGGEIVYSTCSLSPLENQLLVEKFLKKRKGRVEVLPIEMEHGEVCGRGRIFLPDQCAGKGPLFAARFKKTIAVFEPESNKEPL